MNWQLYEMAYTWIFVFLITPVNLTEGEKLLNRRMMKYWANFARYG